MVSPRLTEEDTDTDEKAEEKPEENAEMAAGSTPPPTRHLRATSSPDSCDAALGQQGGRAAPPPPDSARSSPRGRLADRCLTGQLSLSAGNISGVSQVLKAHPDHRQPPQTHEHTLTLTLFHDPISVALSIHNCVTSGKIGSYQGF